jgi:hypothetical protein
MRSEAGPEQFGPRGKPRGPDVWLRVFLSQTSLTQRIVNLSTLSSPLEPVIWPLTVIFSPVSGTGLPGPGAAHMCPTLGGWALARQIG